MENTLARFENDTEAKWFIAQSGKLMGPISGKEVAHWVSAKGISIGNFIWCSGQANWQRIYDVPEFNGLLPQEPSAALKAEAAKQASDSAPPPQPTEQTDRVWFVYTNNAQYGPFEKEEVQMMMDSGRVTSESYLWKKGMLNWEGAATVSGFQMAAPDKASEAPAASSEQRTAPRKPFEAKILMTDGQEVGWAICRDVSIGGMQVLMDHSPGQVGTVLKLNVSAADAIPAFTCEGTIVRVLEDGRGFSFRFDNLPDEARQAIEQYVSMA